MTRKLVDAIFVQARAYDGKKESSVTASNNNVKNVERWLHGQVVQYRRFKKQIKGYPGHKPRLAYVVKLYLKEQPCTQESAKPFCDGLS